MTLSHTTTFFIMFAFALLSLVYLYEGDYLVVVAYASALASWVVVACYEYNERVFNRAIQAIIAKYAAEEAKDQ